MEFKSIKSNLFRNKKSFFVIGILWALFITYLNWDNRTMSGLLDYYQDFADLIKNNFNLKVVDIARPTWPMWGYGFIFNFTNSKTIIIGIQIILFLILFAFSLNARIRKVLSINNSLLPSILLFLPSFIAIFSTLTPYSVAIFFLTISIIFYGIAFDNFISDLKLTVKSLFFKRTLLIIIFSGLFAGVTMNFRSDYTLFLIAMPILSGLVFFIWLKDISKIRRFFYKFLIMMMAFYLSLFLIMIPWMTYTSTNFNKRLMTSTNTGHVFFIGLGQLPNNKWNITTADADPVKTQFLQKNGIEDSLSIEGDSLLKKQFFKLVLASPYEYFKKVCLGFVRVLFGGIYIPEFFEISSCSKLNASYCRDLAKTIAKGQLQNLSKLNLNYFLRIIFTSLSFFASSAIVLIGLALLPRFLLEAWAKRSFVLILPGLAILYQSLIGIFAFHMPLYMTNVYIFLVIVISNTFTQKYQSSTKLFK